MTEFNPHRAHPWHGVSYGADAPEIVTCYIEIVPTDTVKFEIDKQSGILKVDRPQKYSNYCPALYGFIPQTYCGDGVGDLCAKSLKRKGKIKGDGDPVDICVLADVAIAHGDILVRARPIGGLKLIDRNEADDKIIAVLEGDGVYGHMKDISDLPSAVIDRLRHYFLTYKQIPSAGKRSPVEVAQVYGRRVAHQVIKQSVRDYQSLLKDSGK
jgi:inorganic pyrophosphatase